MAMPRSFITHPSLADRNLLPGEGENPAKRVDGSLFDANNADLATATALRQGFGDDFSDNGSSPGECRVTTTVGLFDGGQTVIVADGTSQWRVVMTGDDDLRFSSAELIEGSGVPSYDSPSLIASLHVWSLGTAKAGIRVGSEELIVGDRPNAFNADGLPRSAANSQSVEAALAELESDLAQEHEGDGNHSAGFVNAGLLDELALADEGFSNFVHGGMEQWPDGDDAPPLGWKSYGSPTSVERATGEALFGESCCKITSGGGGRGISFTVPNFSDYRGREVVISAWVRAVSPTNEEARLLIDDGASTSLGEAIALSGGYQRIYCRKSVSPTATKLELIIASAPGDSPVFYVDGVSGYVGGKLKAWQPSVAEALTEDDVVPGNFLLGGDFGRLSETADGPLPLGWEKLGAGNLSTESCAGRFGGGLTLLSTTSPATGIRQRLGAVDEVLDFLRGRTVTFSIWVKAGGAFRWTLRLDDGEIELCTLTFEAAAYTDWKQLAITKTIAPTADKLELQLYRSDGLASLSLDGACLNLGSRPHAGGSASIWQAVEFTWKQSGTLIDESWLDLALPASRSFYPLRLDGCCLTAPTGGSGESLSLSLYRGERDGTPQATGLSLDLPCGDNGADTAQPSLTNAAEDKVAATDYLRVFAEYSGLASGAADGVVTLTGYQLVL